MRLEVLRLASFFGLRGRAIFFGVSIGQSLCLQSFSLAIFLQALFRRRVGFARGETIFFRASLGRLLFFQIVEPALFRHLFFAMLLRAALFLAAFLLPLSLSAFVDNALLAAFLLSAGVGPRGLVILDFTRVRMLGHRGGGALGGGSGRLRRFRFAFRVTRFGETIRDQIVGLALILDALFAHSFFATVILLARGSGPIGFALRVERFLFAALGRRFFLVPRGLHLFLVTFLFALFFSAFFRSPFFRALLGFAFFEATLGGALFVRVGPKPAPGADDQRNGETEQKTAGHKFSLTINSAYFSASGFVSACCKIAPTAFGSNPSGQVVSSS